MNKIDPNNYICPECGESCKIIPLDNAIHYSGTHCTHGKDGVYYPPDYGTPVSSCCEAPIDVDINDLIEEGYFDF